MSRKHKDSMTDLLARDLEVVSGQEVKGETTDSTLAPVDKSSAEMDKSGFKDTHDHSTDDDSELLLKGDVKLAARDQLPLTPGHGVESNVHEPKHPEKELTAVDHLGGVYTKDEDKIPVDPVMKDDSQLDKVRPKKLTKPTDPNWPLDHEGKPKTVRQLHQDRIAGGLSESDDAAEEGHFPKSPMAKSKSVREEPVDHSANVVFTGSEGPKDNAKVVGSDLGMKDETPKTTEDMGKILGVDMGGSSVPLKNDKGQPLLGRHPATGKPVYQDEQ